MLKIERLLENKEMHQLEIKKLHQKQAKLQLVSKYLKQAKKKNNNWKYSNWIYCFIWNNNAYSVK